MLPALYLFDICSEGNYNQCTACNSGSLLYHTKSFSTVLVVSPAALLNSNSASSTLNVNSFFYLAAIEAIANMQYLIREDSKSQPTNNDDRYQTCKNSFIFIAVNSCVNILFALCGTHTIKNISLHIQYCFSSSNFNKKLLNCFGCIFSSSPKFA